MPPGFQPGALLTELQGETIAFARQSYLQSPAESLAGFSVYPGFGCQDLSEWKDSNLRLFGSRPGLLPLNYTLLLIRPLFADLSDLSI